MDETTIKASMNNVGQEPGEEKETQTKENPLLDAAKEQYWNWLLGLGISCIPLFSLPLYHAFNSDISVWGFFLMLFSSCEVAFIGVSLAVTSLNDYTRWKKKKQGKIRWNLLLITVGAIAYGIMAICSSSEKFNDLLAFGFNIAFLVIIIVLSSAEYIQQIQEAK